MTESNPFLQKEFSNLKASEISKRLIQLTDFSNNYIQQSEASFDVITEDEHSKTSTPEDTIKILEGLESDLNTVAIIFQNRHSQTIAIIFNFEENRSSFSLMLKTKELNKQALSELIKLFDLKPLPEKEQIKMNENEIIVNPIFTERTFENRTDNCFIVMPFSESWSNRLYTKLQSILTSKNIEPIRADDLYGQNVLEDIWKAINESTLIIADTTNKNPNVFYEIGIAHTLGKEVILITQDIGDIPFDFRMFRHIAYEDNVDGFDSLEKELLNSLNAR